jgi:hypothetical protein
MVAMIQVMVVDQACRRQCRHGDATCQQNDQQYGYLLSPHAVYVSICLAKVKEI